MPRFGRTSQSRLHTCDQRLQSICNAVLPIMDFSIICGTRSEEEQNALPDSVTKVRYPDSKHNHNPSLAVDICPWRDGKLQWDDRDAFDFLAGMMFAIAHTKGIKLRWGGNWRRDFDLPGNEFDDLGHFELVL